MLRTNGYFKLSRAVCNTWAWYFLLRNNRNYQRKLLFMVWAVERLWVDTYNEKKQAFGLRRHGATIPNMFDGNHVYDV